MSHENLIHVIIILVSTSGFDMCVLVYLGYGSSDKTHFPILLILIFSQLIPCGCWLESSHRDDSNELPQGMVLGTILE